MVGLFQQHGAIAFAILIGGLGSIVTGLLAIAVSNRSKNGAKVGLLALGLVAATATVTVVAVMGARLRVDRAVAELAEPDKTLATQAGYSRSTGLSKLGAALAGVGFVASVIGTMRGLSVRERAARADSKREPELGEMSDSSLGLGVLVVGAIALFSVVASAMPLVMKAPGLDLAPDDPARKFRDAEAMLSDGRVEEGCAALEEGFAKKADPKKAKIRSVDGLVTECFDQRLEQAMSAADAEEFDRVTTALQETKMPLDESQRKRLDDALAMRREQEP